MDEHAVKCSSVAPSKSKFATIVSKVIGIAPNDRNVNGKSNEKEKKDPSNNTQDELQERVAAEAFLAQLFASITAIKAAYAHLQFAQSPYDPDAIETEDQTIVAELQNLAELKQSFVKKQVNTTNLEITFILSEIREVKSLQKIFEILIRKLDSELKLKESEITFMKEKLAGANQDNKSLEKKLYSSGQIAVPDGIRLLDLNQNHFIVYSRQAVKSIRSFVRMLISEMESARWNLDKAVEAIEPRATFWTPEHRFYAFESFVCKEMFNGFNHPSFQMPSMEDPGNHRSLYLDQFTELKPMGPTDYLAWKPQSPFATFCCAKFLKLIHPKMEASFFGNTNQLDLVNSSDVPDTPFFLMFAEMAKRVWLLHCLARALDPPVLIFVAGKGSRFSEVYMESISDEVVLMTERDPQVAFPVVPGFHMGKTVIQCQVYLC